MNAEKFNKMESYTFDEGVAFLVFVKAPVGVINHLKTTHNRNHLHGEIHKQLRFPKVKQLLKQQGCDSEIQKSSVETPLQNNDETCNSETANENDDAEIVLTKIDVKKHENTRFEDMPNDLCRSLWLQRQEVYREMQQAHLKMRSVPQGEKHNEERAKWRAEVLRLDEINDSFWNQIDAEIERFNDERKEEKKVEQSAFNVSTYRTYVSKALRKNKLSPEQFAELQHRVDALLSTNEELKPETVEKLKSIGIKVG